MQIIAHPSALEQAALDYCAYSHEARVHYANFIEYFRRGSAQVCYASADGLLVYDRISKCYSMSAQTMAAAEEMIAHIDPSAMLFTGRECFYEEALFAKTGLKLQMRCTQVVYDTETRGRAPLALPEFDGEIRPLGPEHAAFVHQHYNDGTEPMEYIDFCIQTGMLGLFVGDELAGFAGFHGEGSMGLLDILPAYRRRGYASVLECAILNRALELGMLYPYGHVVQGNEASFALQAKLTLETDATELFWAFKE